MADNDIGIDYSGGMANRDLETGIHYGVININRCSEWAHERFEDDYGKPTCPKCGNEAVDLADATEKEDDTDDYEQAKYECIDYVCHECKYTFGSESAYPEDLISRNIDTEELQASLDSYNDIFVIKSEFYTRCAYCSPCAPGAGYLTNQRENGIKAYCLPVDFFDNENPCPYKIWRVSDDTLVYDPSKADDKPVSCPRCGEESLRSTYIEISDSVEGLMSLCVDCAAEYLVSCKFCESRIAEHTAHVHQHGHVCGECWNERLRVTE